MKLEQIEEELLKELTPKEKADYLLRKIELDHTLQKKFVLPDYSNTFGEIFVFIFVLLCSLAVFHPGLNNYLDNFLKPILNTDTTSNIQERQSDRTSGVNIRFKQTLVEGNIIAGKRVTSRFNPNRVNPVTGTVIPHNGVDVALPIGAPIYAVLSIPEEEVTVKCYSTSAGGNVASYASPSLKREFKSAHLSACYPGKHKRGAIIARSGNTGRSTGPHLHFEQHERNRPIPPYAEYTYETVAGRKVQEDLKK